MSSDIFLSWLFPALSPFRSPLFTYHNYELWITRGGHWGMLETAKPKKKSSKTENLTYSQKRKTQKPHWIIKLKNRYFYENQKPDAKKPKPANLNKHQN